MFKEQSRNKYLIIILTLILSAFLPLLFNDAYKLGILVVVGIFTIVVIGLSLLMGYAGQISLGHAAFYGLGAYISAILSAKYQVNPWLAMIIAAAATGLISYLIGIPVLKLKEHYLALGTLGLGLIIHAFFVEESILTGGPSGLSGIPPLAVGSFSFNTDFRFYYLVWAVAVISIFLVYNIVHSRVGRALRSIHGSEYAARSLGINIAKYKLQVFTLSAVLASIAGSLYAHYSRFISPSSFDFMASVNFLVMAVVGGLGSIWGPVLGAGAIAILDETLKNLMPVVLPKATGEYQIIIYGALLAVMMIFMPEGLVYGIKKLLNRLRATLNKGRKDSLSHLTREGESI